LRRAPQASGAQGEEALQQKLVDKRWAQTQHPSSVMAFGGDCPIFGN
jgi:hypothetical protein